MDRPWIAGGLRYAELADDDLPSLLVQRVACLRVRTGIDRRFLTYLIGSPRFASYILGIQTGTAVPHISSRQIRDFVFTLPALPVQRAVGALLGAFDDKIAVNNKITRTCDELRTLKLGQWTRSNPQLTQERPLSSLAEFVNGRAFTNGATGAGRMVIRIAEINSGPGGSTVYNEIEVPGRHLARPGDVLCAWSGSLVVARWFRPETIINQHIFKVIPNGGVPGVPGAPVWLAFELVKTKLAMFRGIAAAKATTMGHIQRRHLDVPVTVPAHSRIAQLDAQLGPLWDRALAAEQESLAIAELRETLLPRLMSGELRIGAAEKLVRDAT